MSEESLLEVAFIAWGNVATMLALLITLISGYMVAAYIVGSKLTRIQVVTINTLYIGMSGFLVWACVEMSRRADLFESTAYSMIDGPVGDLTARGDIAVGIISAFSLAIIATLKFMWDIRHPKDG